jgi:hypothetical protein
VSCLHEITVDLLHATTRAWYRACALCGEFYNRTARVLDPLRARCEAAWAINFTKYALDDEDALEIAG